MFFFHGPGCVLPRPSTCRDGSHRAYMVRRLFPLGCGELLSRCSGVFPRLCMNDTGSATGGSVRMMYFSLLRLQMLCSEIMVVSSSTLVVDCPVYVCSGVMPAGLYK